MGWLNSLGNWTGSNLNNVTGATSSAKQAFNYSKQLAEQQNEYQKEFAQNAHQWEVADMEAAGINPILSADSNGASAGGAGGGGTGSAAQANIGITDIANSAAQVGQTLSNIDLQKTQEKVNETQALKNTEETGMIKPEANARIKNMVTNSAVNEAKTKEIQSQIALNSAKTTAQKGTKEYIGGTAVEMGQNFKKKLKKEGYKEPTKEQREKGYLF